MSSRTKGKNKKDNAEYMNGEFIIRAKSFDKVAKSFSLVKLLLLSTVVFKKWKWAITTKKKK